jgi:hypothetical protein
MDKETHGKPPPNKPNREMGRLATKEMGNSKRTRKLGALRVLRTHGIRHAGQLTQTIDTPTSKGNFETQGYRSCLPRTPV